MKQFIYLLEAASTYTPVRPSTPANEQNGDNPNSADSLKTYRQDDKEIDSRLGL